MAKRMRKVKPLLIKAIKKRNLEKLLHVLRMCEIIHFPMKELVAARKCVCV